jgi:cytidylate kinase
MIITIDGAAGTGKSTVAQQLAKALGFIFFDTGAMYRILTYAILKHKILFNQPEKLQPFLKQFTFQNKWIQGERHYFYEEEDISQSIRSKEVTENVSEIAALEAVRNLLTTLQRNLAIGTHAVFEGRDMGTVVFPTAEIKIFLTGKDEIRALRRYQEMKHKSLSETENLTVEECLIAINHRDAYDTSRVLAPLQQARDAYIIDTSSLSIDEVVDKILEYIDSLTIDKPSL